MIYEIRTYRVKVGSLPEVEKRFGEGYEYRKKISTANLQVTATFLVDGRVAGTWRIERKKKAATLTLTPFQKLSKPAKTCARRTRRKPASSCRLIPTCLSSLPIRLR